MNIDKSQSDKIVSDLLQGDNARILEKKLFKKDSDPHYTSVIYTVESVHGKTIHSTNGQIKLKKWYVIQGP